MVQEMFLVMVEGSSKTTFQIQRAPWKEFVFWMKPRSCEFASRLPVRVWKSLLGLEDLPHLHHCSACGVCRGRWRIIPTLLSCSQVWLMVGPRRVTVPVLLSARVRLSRRCCPCLRQQFVAGGFSSILAFWMDVLAAAWWCQMTGSSTACVVWKTTCLIALSVPSATFIWSLVCSWGWSVFWVYV